MSSSAVLLDVDALRRERARWAVLDASWVYPRLAAPGVDVRAVYRRAHLPGSLFLDLEALMDPADRLDPAVPSLAPPSAATLWAALGGAGIGRAQPIVVTDMEGGTATAPLARWALLDAGFGEVRLLDGGTPAWREAGFDLVEDAPTMVAGPRRPAGGGGRSGGREGRFVTTAETARAVFGEAPDLVVDARFVASNAGVLPERYAEMVLPTGAVLRPGEVLEDRGLGQRFRPAAAIRELATARGIGPGPVIVTCHFGVGAAVVATALELAGYGNVRVDRFSLLGWARAQAAG